MGPFFVVFHWQIWHKAPPGVWQKLLCQLELLLVSPTKGVVSCNSVNWKAFMEAKAIAKLLMASKVGWEDSQSLHLHQRLALCVQECKVLNFPLCCVCGVCIRTCYCYCVLGPTGL